MNPKDIDPKEGLDGQAAPETPDAGAAFWAYLSPQNNTSGVVKEFTITLTQGDWQGEMTRERPTLQTPGMSGEFDVRVVAGFGDGVMRELGPISWSKPNIGCNSNCKGMVGIVATEDGQDAQYWTTWDAVCTH